jgi:myo-inositol 2-dehydrogenase/D-chiro-inositol 1-dehydrogenase
VSARRPARLAVIGVGRIGAQHAAAIASSPRLQLAAVVDPNPAALASVSTPGASAFADLDALLAAGGIDAAIVAAPSARHVALVTRLLSAGVPVLCEKPCGLRSTDVLQLAELADRAGVPLHVGYWRRFVPALRELRAQIVAGGLGEIAMLVAVQWDGQPPAPEFRDPASSGGIAVDMGVHDFDMVRWLTGQELGAVTGFASDVTWADPVAGDPETVNLVVRMSRGATAVVSLARRHPPGDLCRVEVIGGEGFAVTPYLQPADADAVMLSALRAQAEALADAIAGTPVLSASVIDASAALRAAEQAGAVLAAQAAGPLPPAAATDAAPTTIEPGEHTTAGATR